MGNPRKRPKRRQLIHLREEMESLSSLRQESASVSKNGHGRSTRPKQRREQKRELRLQTKQRYFLRSSHHVNKIKNKNMQNKNIAEDKVNGPSTRLKGHTKKKNVQNDKESRSRRGSLHEPGNSNDGRGVPKNSRGGPSVADDSKDGITKSNIRGGGRRMPVTSREEKSVSLNTAQGNKESSLSVRPKVYTKANLGDHQSSSQTRHYGPHSVTFIGSNSPQPSGFINKSCFRCGKRIIIITAVDSLSQVKQKVKCSSCAEEPVKQDSHFCHHCKRDFVDESSLLRHYELHLGIPAFRCPTCKQRFPDQAQLQEHSLIHVRPLSPNAHAKLEFFAYFLPEFKKP